uniref:ATP synthase F0 subunit 8 n=1 Tax=Hediste diversicolor TaxID=126592 RepID=A0A7T8G485_HEDDI|nr:ATP synthase F0 subunit 8 [Hediste diversicolor]QQP21528.1 ATP synthase F0 subunit 8 [Hediste diversicolor]
MPHLSPMNWIIVPLIMVLTLIILTVIMWWQFMPKFPGIKSANSFLLLKKQWPWW